MGMFRHIKSGDATESAKLEVSDVNSRICEFEAQERLGLNLNVVNLQMAYKVMSMCDIPEEETE